MLRGIDYIRDPRLNKVGNLHMSNLLTRLTLVSTYLLIIMFDLEMTHMVDNRAGDVKPVQFAQNYELSKSEEHNRNSKTILNYRSI